jgi:hypothetical protein
MKAPLLNIGLEVEMIYNSDRVNDLAIGGYHSGLPFGHYWKAERDGSLHGENRFKFEDTVEFVSKVLRGKADFNNALDDLKFSITQKIKEEGRRERAVRLNSIAYFNKSCGLHIHMSLAEKEFKFFEKASPHIFPKVRKFFFKKLWRSTFISEETKHAVAHQYDRRYARARPVELLMQRNERQSEFNFISEEQNRGIEWRSFNVNECQSWTEFYWLLRIGYDTMEYLAIQATSWKEPQEVFEMNIVPVVRKKTHSSYTYKIFRGAKDVSP